MIRLKVAVIAPSNPLLADPIPPEIRGRSVRAGVANNSFDPAIHLPLAPSRGSGGDLVWPREAPLTNHGVDHGLAETYSVPNFCETEQTFGRLRGVGVRFGRHMRDSASLSRAFATPPANQSCDAAYAV